MELIETTKVLKGGSLSVTMLVTNELTGDKFVRKQVSRIANREYGYNRWYSQLKRQQRYSLLAEGLFPKILEYGSDLHFAYFNMEYIDGSITAYDFLKSETDTNKIDLFFENLKKQMSRLHNIRIDSCRHIANLYTAEEVFKSIEACNSEFFKNHVDNFNTLIFNGQEVPSFKSKYFEFKDMLNLNYNIDYETLSHGNLTLENILYNPETDLITFIDPYEENVIDSYLADYSQLLQSCNSKYEMINESTPRVDNNEITTISLSNFGLDYFNKIFNKYLKNKLIPELYKVVKLLEVSQFIRMLPFKQEINTTDMIVFYGLASKLFNDIVTEYE